jgi:uncharacterized cupin superfamily protein
MVERAKMSRTEHGLVPEGPGWYVLNAAEAEWGASDRHGKYCTFEGDTRFERFGVNIHTIAPGQAACMYHRESHQEAFLVLEGECLLLIEEEEIPLRRWDFVHCPPGTNHVFVGAGDGPCAILMIGDRTAERRITYPVSPVARKHGAGVERETDSPQEAYAGVNGWKTGPAWPL